jgi:hypothetical protein
MNRIELIRLRKAVIKWLKDDDVRNLSTYANTQTKMLRFTVTEARRASQS